MENNQIEFLKNLLNEAILDEIAFDVWKSKVVNTLTRIYGEKSSQIDQINKVKFKKMPDLSKLGGMTSSSSFEAINNNLDECKRFGIELVKGFIDDIEINGFPDKNEKNQDQKELNIVVNQLNSQNMSIKFTIILKTIQDELSEDQYFEVLNIIKSKENFIDKKNKLFEKLKSFGSDLITNIVVNLLTNPQIYN
jgi:hypothetical protein